MYKLPLRNKTYFPKLKLKITYTCKNKMPCFQCVSFVSEEDVCECPQGMWERKGCWVERVACSVACCHGSHRKWWALSSTVPSIHRRYRPRPIKFRFRLRRTLSGEPSAVWSLFDLFIQVVGSHVNLSAANFPCRSYFTDDISLSYSGENVSHINIHLRSLFFVISAFCV
jgi:hypothetical protein